MTDPKRAMAIVSRDISPKDEHGNRQDPAAVMAGRLSSGLLDRLNGAVRDDWTAGIIPPIKASRNTAAPRPGAPERTPHHPTGRRPRPTGRHGRTALVEDRHGNGAETRRPQPAARRGHLPGHVDIDDPDQPIGQRPPPVRPQEQHWCTLAPHTTEKEAASPPRKANRNRPENPTPRVGDAEPRSHGGKEPAMEDTAGTIIEQLARCADAMTRTLDSWDTGTPDRPRRHAHGARRRHRPRHHRRRTHQADPVDHRHRHTHPHRRRDRLDHREPIPAHPRARNAPAKPRRPPAPVPEPGHGGTHTTMVTMGKRDTME